LLLAFPHDLEICFQVLEDLGSEFDFSMHLTLTHECYQLKAHLDIKQSFYQAEAQFRYRSL